MHNTISSNVRAGDLPLRTFFFFGTILLLTIGSTWWVTHNYYNTSETTDRMVVRLDSSLIYCNSLIQHSNEAILNEMDDKSADPATREKALIWNPRAKSALIFTQNIQQHLSKIRSSLIGSGKGEPSSFHQNNILNEIFDSINSFNSHLISVIPTDKVHQLGVLPTQALVLNTADSKVAWKEKYFKGLSNNAIGATLSKIEFDIARSTNIILNYMNYQSESLVHYCEFFVPLISQNSTVFLPGQTLEITAGLGVYSSMTNPKIKINNEFIQMNEYGTVTYKKIINSSKSGFVPIVVSYKDPNTGELRTLSKSITYTVFQPPK